MNATYLLDTNIISEFSKQEPNQNVLALYTTRKNLCAISAITWQELKRGISRLPEGKKKNTLESFILNLESNIQIVPYDKFASGLCGELQANAEKEGTILPYYDSQIAATAISNGLVLVTHNTKDFSYAKEKAYLRVEDWFEA